MSWRRGGQRWPKGVKTQNVKLPCTLESHRGALDPVNNSKEKGNVTSCGLSDDSEPGSQEGI